MNNLAKIINLSQFDYSNINLIIGFCENYCRLNDITEIYICGGCNRKVCKMCITNNLHLRNLCILCVNSKQNNRICDKCCVRIKYSFCQNCNKLLVCCKIKCHNYDDNIIVQAYGKKEEYYKRKCYCRNCYKLYSRKILLNYCKKFS